MITRIIVNADDLGRSQVVNDRLFALMDQGKVTSATIVASGEAVEDVARRCGAYSHCSFGVHLFMDEFRPVTDSSAFSAVLRPDGGLNLNPRTQPFTTELRPAIVAEWVAQVDRVRSLGIPVSHLDSHHHVHLAPQVFGLLKAVQRRTGIRKVRICANLGDRLWSARLPKILLKGLFHAAVRYYVPTVTTTHFASFGEFHGLLDRGLLPRPASLELMVHPGAATYMKTKAETIAVYEDELTGLNLGWSDRLPWEHKFISYNDL